MAKRPHMRGSKRLVVAGLTEDCILVVLVGCRTFTKNGIFALNISARVYVTVNFICSAQPIEA